MAERSNAPDFVASAANDESSGPAPALITVLGRDVLLLVALTLWAAADAWHIVSEMPFAGALAVADAVLAGLLLASLTHEWGHYAGAQWTKADAPLVRPTTFSLFRYNYNFDANEPRQFQVMSVASHVATLALIVAFASMLDVRDSEPDRFLLCAGGICGVRGRHRIPGDLQCCAG